MARTLLDVSKTQAPESYVYTRLAALHFGEIASIVVSKLMSYERLTAAKLADRCNLPKRKVDTALVSLAQFNCVSYWADRPKAPVHFSINTTGLKVLLHGGDIIMHMRHLYSNEAAEVVQNAIEHGHLAVKNYMSLFEDPAQRYSRMEVLVRLYLDGWLRPLQSADFLPVEDVWNRLFQETLKVTPRSSAVSEVKRLAEVKLATKAKLVAGFSEGRAKSDVLVAENGVLQLRPHIVLTVDLARYEKALRSRAIVDLAALRMGILAAQVYAVCCSLIEQKSPAVKNRLLEVSGLVQTQDEAQALLEADESHFLGCRLTVFSVHDVARALPQDLDLSNSVTSRIFANPAQLGGGDLLGLPNKKIKLEDGSAFPARSSFDALSGGPNKPDLALVEEHLQLLSANTVPFLVRLHDGSYTIPFLQLTRAVKSYNYDALVKTTMGVEALRIFRCIKDQKLADDRTIAKLVLQKEQLVKSLLFDLVASNFIQIQEIPRSADRAATKSAYLFRHEARLSYQYVEKFLLFNMGEVLDNIEQFKLQHKILLEKCERDDVRGYEEELLLEAELKTLKELQMREVSNIGRMNRVKWLYVIFGEL